MRDDLHLILLIVFGPYLVAYAVLAVISYGVVPHIKGRLARWLLAAFATGLAVWHQVTAWHYYFHVMGAWARGMPDVTFKERVLAVALSATTTWILLRIVFKLVATQPQRGESPQPGVQPRVSGK